jgi:hypothetical protein
MDGHARELSSVLLKSVYSLVALRKVRVLLVLLSKHLAKLSLLRNLLDCKLGLYGIL